MLQRLSSSLVRHGKAVLRAILPTTPDSAGGVSEAFENTQHRVQLRGLTTTNEQLVVKEGTKVDMQGVLRCEVNQRGLAAMNLENHTQIDGGRIEGTAVSGALMVEEGKKNIRASNIHAKSTGIQHEGKNPSYAFSFTKCEGVHISDVSAEGYTGGIMTLNVRNCTFRGLRFENMIYHPELVAGGYGVVSSGSNFIVSDLLFKCHPTQSGRHGVYVTSYNDGGVNVGNTNTLYNGGILDYTPWSVAGANPAGAINIRECNKTIITNYVVDGTDIGGILNWGDCHKVLITGNVVRTLRREQRYRYGIQLPQGQGEGAGVYDCYDSAITNNIVTIEDAGTTPDSNYAAIVVSGQRNMFNGNKTHLPAGGSPFLVRDGATDCAIIGNFDTSPTGNEFIRFDGSATRITLKGNVTNRKWFRAGNLSNVTDMTVDFTRSCTVTNGAGGATKSDFYELIESISYSGANIVVKFASHVTQNALEHVQVGYSSANTLAVITSRANKSLTLRVTDYSGTVLGTTANYGLVFTLHS